LTVGKLQSTYGQVHDRLPRSGEVRIIEVKLNISKEDDLLIFIDTGEDLSKLKGDTDKAHEV
jgi:hypothetical protein